MVSRGREPRRALEHAKYVKTEEARTEPKNGHPAEELPSAWVKWWSEFLNLTHEQAGSGYEGPSGAERQASRAATNQGNQKMTTDI